MGLLIGQAKFIVYPRITKLESELPEHRELKIIKNKKSNSEDVNRFLIDFKPKKDEDFSVFEDNVEDDYEEDEENGDNDEESDIK